MFQVFKRKSKNQETLEAVKKRIAQNQESVYQAVKEMGRPVKGMDVARKLGWDSASVTNRLSELVKKGRLKVDHKKRGLDGVWRRYYVVNRKDV